MISQISGRLSHFLLVRLFALTVDHAGDRTGVCAGYRTGDCAGDCTGDHTASVLLVLPVPS